MVTIYAKRIRKLCAKRHLIIKETRINRRYSCTRLKRQQDDVIWLGQTHVIYDFMKTLLSDVTWS